MSAFKLRHPAQVKADADAYVARVLAPMDELLSDMRKLAAGLFSDGVLPDRRTEPR